MSCSQLYILVLPLRYEAVVISRVDDIDRYSPPPHLFSLVFFAHSLAVCLTKEEGKPVAHPPTPS
jgi:hypothetical protein